MTSLGRDPFHPIRRLIAAAPASRRTGLLRLARRLNRWNQLVVLLESARDDDLHVRQAAVDLLASWLRRDRGIPIPPSSDQSRLLRAELAASGPHLPASIQRELEVLLKA